MYANLQRWALEVIPCTSGAVDFISMTLPVRMYADIDAHTHTKVNESTNAMHWYDNKHIGIHIKQDYELRM